AEALPLLTTHPWTKPTCAQLTHHTSASRQESQIFNSRKKRWKEFRSVPVCVESDRAALTLKSVRGLEQLWFSQATLSDLMHPATL
ncbi:hypothetical protein LEMLEM_LOCUS24158, partial [Lemmus lemmus]